MPRSRLEAYQKAGEFRNFTIKRKARQFYSLFFFRHLTAALATDRKGAQLLVREEVWKTRFAMAS